MTNNRMSCQQRIKCWCLSQAVVKGRQVAKAGRGLAMDVATSCWGRQCRLERWWGGSWAMCPQRTGPGTRLFGAFGMKKGNFGAGMCWGWM